MKACIIMHNMIIEDEGEVDLMNVLNTVEKMWYLPMSTILILTNLLRHTKN
jgi:hypothetical protein